MFSSRKYTLNFDGSHNNQANKAGAGCIIRDDNGNLIVAASYNLTKSLNQPYYNVAIAEAIGLRNGLKLAQNNYLNLNYIKGDNKEVIDHVLGEHRRLPEPTLARIINEIKVLFGQGFTEIMLVNRTENKVADKLASIGSLQLGDSMVYPRDHIIPTEVIDLIEQDKTSLNGEGSSNSSSLASNIGKAGAAVAGVTMLAWGISKLFSDDSSSSSRPTQPPSPWKSLTDTLASFSQNPPESPAFPTFNTPKAPLGFFTLQYFGSDRNQLQKARAGCIITNRGKFLVAGAYNLDDHYPDCNIAIAEAIALWKGLQLAKANNVRLDVIQGRNVEVRDRVLGVEKRPSKTVDLENFIRQIRVALCDQRVDVDKCLELVDEERIKVARALSTEGGGLEREEMVYRSVGELPIRVRGLFG